MVNFNEEENTKALVDYAKNLDKYVEPLEKAMRENGDWEKLVKTMRVLSEI